MGSTTNKGGRNYTHVRRGGGAVRRTNQSTLHVLHKLGLSNKGPFLGVRLVEIGRDSRPGFPKPGAMAAGVRILPLLMDNQRESAHCHAEDGHEQQVGGTPAMHSSINDCLASRAIGGVFNI